MRRALLAALALALLIPAPAAAQLPGGAPQAPPGAVNRYYSASTNTHWITPTPVAGDYAFEFPLGFLLTTPGAGRVPVYGCVAGAADHYLSHDAACEGYTVLGLYGWAYAERPAEPSLPLYRCLRPGIDHFASNDAACEGFTTELRIGYLRARQTQLSRYVEPSASYHWVTSGLVSSTYGLESGLGFLLDADGPGRRALYECASGADRFLSLDKGCEGRSELGLSGWLYAAPPAGEDVVPLYRCLVPGKDHFASTSANCEGQTTEILLGYLRRTQELINRAYLPAANTHHVTTAPLPPGAFFEFSLGFALTREGADRAPFYGCLAGTADHFLSFDPACEGQAPEGRQGWLYGAPPPGVETAALYRCQRPGIDHFASTDPACEGFTTEARLGFVRTAGPEPPPPPPEPLRLTCAPSDIRVDASLRGRSVRRVRYGGSSLVTGRVRNPDGSPVVAVPVSILIGARKPIALGEVRTRTKGRFSFRVRPGKNRIIHAGYRPTPNAPDLACSRNLRLNVRAGLRLRAAPKRIRAGRRVRFSGRLLGHPIPKVGKLIDLQAFDGGRWRTFQTLRTNAKGSFRARYRFTRTFRTRTFRFRARARRESRYPYALGVSKVVRVRVRAR